MPRVCIIGIPGSGKSTLARRLGAARGLPVVHLDQHYFEPGWQAKAAEDWAVLEAELLAGEDWILDGAFAMDRAIELADTIVWLDFSRARSMARAVRRNLTHRRTPPPDFAPGCEERFDKQFLQLLRYIWRYPTLHDVPKLLMKRGSGVHIVRLRSPRQVRRYVTASADRAGRR